MTKENKPSGLNKLAEFSIRHPVTICMILLSFLVLGGVSGFKIPLVLFPEVDAPFVFVRIPYPNATPEQIEQTITKPLEEILSTIPNVQRLTSYSNVNDAFIRLNFAWGLDMELIRSEVREKVEQARADLPEDIENIYVESWNTNEIPIMEGRIASGRDLRGSYDFLDLKIKKPLERVPGVGEVRIDGVQRKEVEIYLRLDDIKRHKVNVDSVFRKLESANLNVSLGRVDDGGFRYGVISRGNLESLDHLREFPINDRGLTLGHIADVRFDNPPIEMGRHLNGSFAIGLEVQKTSDANTVETVNRVMAKIDELNEDPSLQGIQVMIWHNAGEEITKSLSGLLNAGTVGALLSVLVLFVFLKRVGPTLAIGFAIPFSIISAVGFLYLLGNTMNVLSMMGLMLSTGMLVDNAVVVLESIFQQLEKGDDRVTAARVGTRSVITAVLASTLTSVIIFVPLVFGKTTEYSVWLSHTGIAIMICLLCSLFVSLTIIPLGVAKLIRVDPKNPGKIDRFLIRLYGVLTVWVNPAWAFVRRGGPLFRRAAARLRFWRKGKGVAGGPDPVAAASAAGVVEPVDEADVVGAAHATFSSGVSGFQEQPTRPSKPWTERYVRLVQWNLRHRYVMGLIVVPVIIAGSFYMMTKLPDNSSEAEDLRDTGVQYEFSENFHYLKIEEEYVTPVEQYLLKNKERFKLKNVYSFWGNNNAHTRMYFDEDKISMEDLKDIRKQIADGLPVIPGAEIRTGRQEGSENQNWISLNLYGDDSMTLAGLAVEARKRLKKNPDFMEVFSDLERGAEEVQIQLNRELARKYRLSPQSVAGVLSIVLRGRQLGGYKTPEGEVDIWIKLRPGDREDLNDLKSMVVGAGPEGQEILLYQVADFHVKKAPGSIAREDRRTTTALYCNYTGAKKEDGKKLVEDVMKSLSFPPGYGWGYGFWTVREEQEDNDFLFNLLLALFMVYFVMASLFESLAHPFAIMLSLLFAFVGVAWFLFFTGTPLNIMAMIGMMILIGIVVNNGIVMLDHVNNLRRAGMPRGEALINGCRERLRPILMTATTTIVGLVPLSVGTSSMLGLRYFPMARTVMGGLAASTILTLIILPLYYELVDDITVWLRRTWMGSSAAPKPAEAADLPASAAPAAEA